MTALMVCTHVVETVTFVFNCSLKHYQQEQVTIFLSRGCVSVVEEMVSQSQTTIVGNSGLQKTSSVSVFKDNDTSEESFRNKISKSSSSCPFFSQISQILAFKIYNMINEYIKIDIYEINMHNNAILGKTRHVRTSSFSFGNVSKVLVCKTTDKFTVQPSILSCDKAVLMFW